MWATFKLVAVIACLSLPAGLVLIPWTLLTGRIQPMYRVGKWIARTGLRAAGIRVQQSGRENIPTDRACLFIPNHVSNLDPPIIGPLLPGAPSIMLKAELMKIPVLGRAWKLARCVPVERTGGRDAAVRSARLAAEVVNSGLSMLIFAEGTRSPDGRLQAFKAGPFHLAQSTGAPIVPVAISGTESMMRKGSAEVIPGLARVQFLPAIDPKDFRTRAELMAAVRSALMEALPESMRPLEAAKQRTI
ncbi:MAG: lysophospholipid acyltransferase family protein [Janthinobacterium lividum]